MFEGFLHDSLRETIIRRIYGSPAADTHDRKELIESALRDHKAAHEVYSIDELSHYKPVEEVISGLRNVIRACNLFLVRKLVISQSLHQKGFVCKQHHYVSLEDAKCPFCNSKLLPVENVVDEIIEIARLHGVYLTVVEHRHDLLATYEGIAALLYSPLGEA
jgi:peptide subunit release factor 1 (eRF1)